MNKIFVIKILMYYLDPLLKLGLMNPLKLRCQDFFIILSSYLHRHNCAYLKFPNKTSSFFRIQVQGYYFQLLFFLVDACKDRTITNDAITSSSILVMLVQDEELEEASIHVNVSQRSYEDKPIERVVHT